MEFVKLPKLLDIEPMAYLLALAKGFWIPQVAILTIPLCHSFVITVLDWDSGMLVVKAVFI